VHVRAELPTGEQVPAIPLPMSVHVVDDIELWPSVVLLSARMEGESVTLRSRTGQTFEVVSASVLSPNLIETVRVDMPAEPSSVSHWVVSLAQTVAKRTKSSSNEPVQSHVQFVVRYSDGRESEVTLPVQFISLADNDSNPFSGPLGASPTPKDGD
jgi:hypothetical protein